MWPTSVTIAGADVPLDVVLADCVIRQGRVSIDDGPVASSTQLRLENVTRAYSRAFTVGVSLAVLVDDAPRFTGTITDAELDDDVLTVIGVGVLATLSRYLIGAGDWPSELWSDRVRRAFAEAGIPELLALESDGDFDPLLVARLGTIDAPLEPVTLYDYVQTLANDVGAAVVDTPDGRILVQVIGSRQPSTVVEWQQVPRTLAWTAALGTWQDATDLANIVPDYPSGASEIDSSDVLYVPAWAQELTLENETTVTLGDGETTSTATNAPSVEAFGSYPAAITTELALAADGERRAGDRVERRGFPRWTIPAVTLLRGYELRVGRQVILTDFPPSSPFATWSPVVEGWTDTISGDDWTTELAVSDPQLSGLLLVWQNVPPALAWLAVPVSVRWLDATELSDLYPSLLREELAHAL